MMGHIQCGRNLLTHLTKRSDLHDLGYKILPSFLVGHGVRYRKLEVILTTSIEKLGKAGETVKVAPGYFRNHLMPKLLAVPNIEKYAYLIREQRKLYQREEAETITVVPKTKEDKMKEYQAAAKRLSNAHLVLRRPIRKDNDLRTPITKDEIVAEADSLKIELQHGVDISPVGICIPSGELTAVARQLCVSVQPENLNMPSNITTLGEFEIPLRLPRSIPLTEGKVNWTLDLKIRRK